jgi:predicted nucleotidyltransferase
MAVLINNYLSTLAYSYYISHTSDENTKIQTSVNNIKIKLNNTFTSKILSISTFGSYERDTILPRKYDSKTDVDILVKFDHATLDKSANTYREWLLKFANDNYTRSTSYKDFPTVVVELSHIAFDLVPAREEVGFFSNQLFIPDSSVQWQPTNPSEFNKMVSDANGKFNNIVKPIIRLMKAWNAMASYPFSTYDLERQVAGMNFSGDNYQTGFFWAIDHLSDSHLSIGSQAKVATLRNNKAWVVKYLNEDNLVKATEALHRIIPFA